MSTIAPLIVNRSSSRNPSRDKLVDPLRNLFYLRGIPALARCHPRALQSLGCMRPVSLQRVDQGQAAVRPLHKRLIVLHVADFQEPKEGPQSLGWIFFGELPQFSAERPICLIG
jgi:hypothetical protein